MYSQNRKKMLLNTVWFIAILVSSIAIIAGAAILVEKGTGVEATKIPYIDGFANMISGGLAKVGLQLNIASEKTPTATSGGQTIIVTPPAGQTPAAGSPEPAALQFTLVNIIGLASITSGTTDITIWEWNGGSPNWLSPVERGVTINSAPEQSVQQYNAGQELVLQVRSQVDPTGGTDYYDEWYYVKLNVGETVRFLDVELGSTTAKIGPIARLGGTQYTNDIHARFVDGKTSTVKYEGQTGQARYWGLASLGVWPRATAANTDIALKWGATTMSSVTDGSSWDDTQAEQNSDVTLTTDNEDFYVTFNLGATALVTARPMYAIDSIGKIHLYPAVLVFSTNATAIGQSTLFNEGFTRLPSGTDGDVQFGKALNPIQGTVTTSGSGSIKIPIDANAAAASTAYDFAVWIIDFQNWDAFKSDIRAMSTSIPTAYGVNGYGLAAVIFAVAYTESSGNPATMQLFGDWTTAA